ncbi:MAG: LysM domain-containing protein [Gemmatimonadota bacterium]
MRRLLNASATLSQRTLLLGLGLALVASPASAQRTRRDSTQALQPGTVLHVVRRGDTLADIARRFLGDFRRWPELFKANAGQIKNANLIFPGQRLYVGADGKPTFNAPVARVEPVDTVVERRVLGRPVAGQATSVLENATLNGRALRPTVRRGEANAAPFLVSLTAKQNSGALMSRADPTVVAAGSNRDQFQLYDDVDVLLPVGARGTVGQKLGVYQLGPEVRHDKLRARLMQPSGVIELVAIGTGRAARARVTAMYANMKRGDVVLPLDSLPAPETVRPSDVANGPVYEVAYVAGGVVLPTIQNYVVLALPAGASSKVGDQFNLYAPGVALSENGGDVAPPNTVAQVSVVRVTPQGATAIVVGHDQPAIRVGMKAQLVSRMP